MRNISNNWYYVHQPKVSSFQNRHYSICHECRTYNQLCKQRIKKWEKGRESGNFYFTKIVSLMSKRVRFLIYCYYGCKIRKSLNYCIATKVSLVRLVTLLITYYLRDQVSFASLIDWVYSTCTVEQLYVWREKYLNQCTCSVVYRNYGYEQVNC